MARGSNLVIYVAAGANLAIAAVKLAAALYTGSSAMLTESIHSFVDTGDQGLLLLGKRRGALAPDESHPFGHGMEEYFWSFVVALMIFSLGGTVSIYEGIHKIVAPEPITAPWVNFAVLGAAFLFEGVSLHITYREFKKTARPTSGMLAALRRSKDPGLFAVLLEDAAALAGLVIAAVGLSVSLLLDVGWADGAASIGIGMVLIGVALFLADETRSLLTGEAAPRALQEKIRRIVEDHASVLRLEGVDTLQLGPRSILVALRLDFAQDGKGAAALARAVARSDERIGRVVFAPPDEAASPDSRARP